MQQYDVVIVGSGFGGLAAARILGRAKVSTCIVSATTEHLFQPLLFQVATGMLSVGEIAPSVRSIVAKYDSIDVRLGTVTAVHADSQYVTVSSDGGSAAIGYRTLIIATGATQSYFGRNDFQHRTFALKTADDAVALRKQIIGAYEAADATDNHARRRQTLSFAIVGAGATGVELAGQIRDLADRYFHSTFPDISPDDVAVTLIDAEPIVSPAFGGRLSDYTRKTLEASGVVVRTGTTVTDIDGAGVWVTTDGSQAPQHIPAHTVIWAAGVAASDLAAVVAEQTNCLRDRNGRLLVNDDLTVGTSNNIFAIGDVTSLHNLPSQSPVAMQQGRHAARMICGKTPRHSAFRYRDKGSMSIIGRYSAVADLFGKVQVTGLLAWVMWLFVHLLYLTGLRNRVVAVASWLGSYLGNKRPHFQYATNEDSTRGLPNHNAPPAA